MSKRRPLSKRKRFEVFKRDGFACQYCGAHPPTVVLEVDHVIALANGGMDDEENLLTACFDCNRGKAAKPLSVVPKRLSEKASETEEREAQLAGYWLIMQARADRVEDDAWIVAEAFSPGSSKAGIRREWLRSIKFFNAQLPLHIVKEAAEIAFDQPIYSERRRFLYFCKVCWNKIKRGDE